jgi:PAS domain S-box-containing protein
MTHLEETSTIDPRMKITGVVLKIVALIFITEIAIMTALNAIGLDRSLSIFIDPLLLAVLTMPLLCRFVVKPLREIIRQQQATVDALMTGEKKYRELTDQLPQTVFELDLKGNFTYSNRHGFEASGYTQTDVDEGLNVYELLSPEDQKTAKHNLTRTLRGELFIATEYTIVRKDKTRYPVLIYSHPILRSGKPAGIRGIAVDISDRKKAEKDLQNTIAELERFNKMAVGRELKMVELKREVNALQVELGRTEKYQVTDCTEVQERI